MLKLILAMSIAAAAPATPAPAPMPAPAIAPADWSAGWEEGYRVMCEITDAQRAAWASAPPLPASDPTLFLEGFHAALDEAADYELAGFDLVEWCGDVHP